MLYSRGYMQHVPDWPLCYIWPIIETSLKTTHPFLCLPHKAPEALCFRVVRPSVRASEARNTLFPPVHGSVGPSDQPWPFSACPSVRPSVCPFVRPERFPGICWRTHGGNGLKFGMLIPVPFWSCSVDFPHYGALLTETGHIWVINWIMWGSECRGASGGIIPTLCVEFCLVSYCSYQAQIILAIGRKSCIHV